MSRTTAQLARANALLDFVRAGGQASESEVLFALWVTGDLSGCAQAEQR